MMQKESNILFFFFSCFIFGCAGSSLLCMGFLYLQQAGATLVAVHRLLISGPPLLWSAGSR